MIRILLVDDHPSVGEGTKTMIEQDSEMSVSVVLSAIEALEIIQTERFDLILCDLNMPGISGLELTKRLIQQDPERKVIIYSGYEIGTHFNLLIESGVSGFISKTASREQLHNAIRCAMRGDAVIPISLLKQLKRNEVTIGRTEVSIEDVSITEKEQMILHEVSTGISNKELAVMLHVSQRNVEYQLSRIFEKLNVRSRSEAIKEAQRLGLISVEQY
ncbi:response regulator transcription factor [Paenibacillus prosopidis]|uniref:LuxR family two component transcriptional regulator n=1 Tax=Paenibacillus prosopidis TaxID=630520 RepID=A0A368VRL5_9BACL|nr:response regulator transcription factor [Paenibacillus prosopidis]RCW44293.1 LuxR family two component transcriptional regulator [Paenibacillus prosopidis]